MKRSGRDRAHVHDHGPDMIRFSADSSVPGCRAAARPDRRPLLPSLGRSWREAAIALMRAASSPSWWLSRMDAERRDVLDVLAVVTRQWL